MYSVVPSQISAQKILCFTFWWESFGEGRTIRPVKYCIWVSLDNFVQKWIRILKKYDPGQRMGTIYRTRNIPLNNIVEVEIFDIKGINFMGPFSSLFGYTYILLMLNMCQSR